MSTMAIMIAAATLGVDYGYKPLADGQIEYIIQLEPATVKAMLNGEEVFSELVPEVKGVRRFRIVVGTGKLPRIKPIAKPKVKPPLPKNLLPKTNEKIELKNPLEREIPNNTPPPKSTSPQEVPPKENEIELKLPKLPELPKQTDTPKSKAEFNPNRYNPDRYNKTADIQPPAVILEPPKLPQEPNQFPPIKNANHTQNKPLTTNEPIPEEHHDHEEKVSDNSTPQDEPDSPSHWGLLTITLLGLFVSVGANIYQGWIGFGLRGKYHAMVDQLYGKNKKSQ